MSIRETEEQIEAAWRDGAINDGQRLVALEGLQAQKELARSKAGERLADNVLRFNEHHGPIAEGLYREVRDGAEALAREIKTGQLTNVDEARERYKQLQKRRDVWLSEASDLLALIEESAAIESDPYAWFDSMLTRFPHLRRSQ